MRPIKKHRATAQVHLGPSLQQFKNTRPRGGTPAGSGHAESMRLDANLEMDVMFSAADTSWALCALGDLFTHYGPFAFWSSLCRLGGKELMP